MPTRLDLRDASGEISSNPASFFREALIGGNSWNAPYTTFIIGVIVGLFVIEVALTMQTGAGSPAVLVGYVFANQPWIAWPLAPFLHRGFQHFAANVAGIYVAAPVEQHASKRQYLGLLVLAGFFSLFADGVKLTLLASERHVAAYGASGFTFGLFGYGLAAPVGSEWRLPPRWWLIVLGGVAGIIAVLKNVALSVGDPVSLKLGHLGGLLVGLAFGYHGRSRQPWDKEDA